MAEETAEEKIARYEFVLDAYVRELISCVKKTSGFVRRPELMTS